MVALDRGKRKCKRYPSPALKQTQCGCLSLKTKMKNNRKYAFHFARSKCDVFGSVVFPLEGAFNFEH